VLSIIRVMANTPHGSWAGCPEFGFRDLLEHSNKRAEKIGTLVQSLNRTLEDLGVNNFRVEAMTQSSAPGADVDQWTIILTSTTEPGRTFSVALGS
jgi:hypothetical protein